MATVMGHVNIVCNDLELNADFLVKHFNFKAGDPYLLDQPWVAEISGLPPGTRAKYIPMVQEETNTRIELLTFFWPESPPPAADMAVSNILGYRHIGFTIPDIHAKVSKLQADGYEFISKPVHVKDLKVWTCYFTGPEGILIQLTQREVAQRG